MPDTDTRAYVTLTRAEYDALMARSNAVLPILLWLVDERAKARRQRTLLHHWQRYGATMQRLVVCQAIMLYGHGSFIRHLQRTLKATEDALRAPWLPQNSPTGQRRLEQATYATERGEVAT